MITVVARWESSQMSPADDWRRWRRLKGAFKIDRFIFTPVMPEMEGYPIEQYDNMMTCLLKADAATPRVFLEPSGYNSMQELPQGDMILITGSAERHNMEHAKVNETYTIVTPQRTTFFPTEAAAIALAIRHGQ